MAQKKAIRKVTKKKVSTQDVEGVETQEVSDVEKKSPVTMIVIVLIIIAGFSVLIWLSQPKTSAYNDFEFVETYDGFWDVHLFINDQPYQIVFRHHPSELEDILVQRNVSAIINELALRRLTEGKGQIYVSLDPQASADLVIAFVEVSKVTGELFNIYNIPTNGAYTKPSTTEDEDHLPVKTCEDADEETLIIWIKTEGENVVATLHDHCIVLQGTTSQDTIRVADRFAYELLGIMVS